MKSEGRRLCVCAAARQATINGSACVPEKQMIFRLVFNIFVVGI